jgi:hypothetical protein
MRCTWTPAVPGVMVSRAASWRSVRQPAASRAATSNPLEVTAAPTPTATSTVACEPVDPRAFRPQWRCVYTPAPGFSGQDDFAYALADPSGETSTATVHVAVAPAPTAKPTAAATAQPTPTASPPAASAEEAAPGEEAAPAEESAPDQETAFGDEAASGEGS